MLSWNLSAIDVVLKAKLPFQSQNQTQLFSDKLGEKWKHDLNIEMLKISDYRCKKNYVPDQGNYYCIKLIENCQDDIL